jgi:hypothetical protein
MFSHVFKGAPKGNKNAAGKHVMSGGNSTHSSRESAQAAGAKAGASLESQGFTKGKAEHVADHGGMHIQEYVHADGRQASVSVGHNQPGVFDVTVQRDKRGQAKPKLSQAEADTLRATLQKEHGSDYGKIMADPRYQMLKTEPGVHFAGALRMGLLTGD